MTIEFFSKRNMIVPARKSLKIPWNALYEKKEVPGIQPSNNIIEKKVDPVSGFPSSNGSVYWYRNK